MIRVFRVAWRLSAILAVSAWGLMRGWGVRLRGGDEIRRIAVLQRAWGRRVLRILGVRLTVHGEPWPCELLVTNHLSYVDVFVLSARLDAVFVAKREIASWPVAGTLCRAVGTIFLDRERRRVLPDVVEAVTAAARGGRTVVFFPEGTSTDGSHVLPFKPALLEAAAREGWRVGWATLRYRTPEGAPPASEAVCWWRDMSLAPHLLRLLALPGFEAELKFGDEPLADPDRKRLAGRLWHAVRAQVALGAVVAAALLLPGCRRDHGPRDLVAAGHVEGTEVRLSSEIGGKLVSFPLMEGDPVAKGQEIARIDATDVQLALATAQAERAGAAAELALKRAGARKEEVAEAEATVEAARGELDAAVKDLERLERLLGEGVVTAKARDDALGRRDVAAGRLNAARQRLAALRAGSRAEEIEAARSKVAAADARIAQLQKSDRDTVVTSLVSGVLTEKVAEEGERVAAGETLAVVTDLAHAWLNVYVGEPDLGRFRLGQAVSVVTDDGKTRQGKITFIASEAEFTPKNVQTRDERVKLVYRVKVGLENQDGFYKPGMPAEARLRE